MPDLPIDPTAITADSIQPTHAGWSLSGSHVAVQLPAVPRQYLYSGWQSWSLTAWVDLNRPVRLMRPSCLQAMQTDPVHACSGEPHGSWYGAVRFPDGQVLFLGALGLDSHVQLDGQVLKGWYENGQGDWFLAYGEETLIMRQYALMLKDRLGSAHQPKPFIIWCSWYSLYTAIHADQLLKILADLDDLPFEVFQVDDGWQISIGDWEPNSKFATGMDGLATHIRETGRKAGLWLAPLLVVPSSSLHRQHPDWLLHDEKGKLVSAGFNWGEQLHALDTTHPAVLAWLASLMKKVRNWGYDYVKLDFLYAGALPGKRHIDMPREAAYRNCLAVIRSALGDAYFLACGAPVIPSLGLCDGLRVGPDVADYWASHRDDNLLMNFATPGTRNAMRTTLNRLWLEPLVHTDPDVVYFRSRLIQMTSAQRSLLQDLATVAGFKATSDVPAWLTASERTALRLFLEGRPEIQKIGPACYSIADRRVDFSPYIGLPPPPGPLTDFLGVLLSVLANIPVLMKLFDALNHRSVEKTLKKNPV
jgi:alpha-galactosidase